MDYVYSITNKINGKQYIGVTNNPERRWSDHKHLAVKSDCIKYAIHHAIAFHGIDNFVFEVIAQFENREDAFKAEAKFILERNTLGENGYNLNSGGRGPIQFSIETRRKISIAAKRRFSSKDERIRHGSFSKGITRSFTTRKRMSESQRGRIQSDETRAKIRASKLGKKINFTDEHRTFLRERIKKLTQSDAHRTRIIELNHKRQGTHLSAEHRAKLGIAIQQLSLNSEIIAVFSTIKQASIELLIPYHHIYRCIHGSRKEAGGFCWRMYTEINVDISII